MLLSTTLLSTLGCTRLCQQLCSRSLHATAVTYVNLRAGKVKPSTGFRKRKLTYEEANTPYTIGVRKSWNSWNTSNLHGEERASETAFEDAFIRKFLSGTMFEMIASEIIIKRRFNTIYITAFIRKQGLSYNKSASKVYFFIGYCEEMLSVLLKCTVKLELQVVKLNTDLTFLEV